jgi:purine-cytosine permease-like protein
VHRVFRVLLVISLPLYGIVTIAILAGGAGGHSPKDAGGFVFAGFMAQLSTAAAYNITYAPYVSDYSRYLARETRPPAIIAAVFFGASTPAVWLIALGAWISTRLGATDGLVGLYQAGNNVVTDLGSITAFVSAMALVATMGMNAYGGMLTALTGIDSIRSIRPTRAWRVVAILVFAAVWYLIARPISAGSAVSVLNSLTLMLYLLVPWTAINLVDFFFVRRGHYAIVDLFRPSGIYGAWSWRGLTAYAVGFLVEVPFMGLYELQGFNGTASYSGYFARHWFDGVDYAWIVGLLVSGGLYWLLARSLDLRAEQPAIADSERELAAIDAAT